MRFKVNRKMSKLELKADIEQKIEAYKQSKNADFDDVQAVLNTFYEASTATDMSQFIQHQYKQAGLEDFGGKYDIWSMGKEYGTFLVWDDFWDNIDKKQKSPKDYLWDILFIDEPYIKVQHSKQPNTGTVPDIPIARNHLFIQKELDYLNPEKRQEEYQKFRIGLGLDNSSNIQIVAFLESYINTIMRKIGYLVDEMKSLDEIAKRVLMVYFHEVGEQIKGNVNTGDGTELFRASRHLTNSMNQAYNVMFLKYCHSDLNYRKLLNADDLAPFLDSRILDSTVNGMKYLVDQKEPHVITLTGYYEKLFHAERAINEILHGEGTEQEPQKEESFIDRVINYALERNNLTRQYEAELFWREYARLREEHPGWIVEGKTKYSKFRNAILKVHSDDISVSIPTMNNWIDKYDRALESFNSMLTNSKKGY